MSSGNLAGIMGIAEKTLTVWRRGLLYFFWISKKSLGCFLGEPAANLLKIVFKNHCTICHDEYIIYN